MSLLPERDIFDSCCSVGHLLGRGIYLLKMSSALDNWWLFGQITGELCCRSASVSVLVVGAEYCLFISYSGSEYDSRLNIHFNKLA